MARAEQGLGGRVLQRVSGRLKRHTAGVYFMGKYADQWYDRSLMMGYDELSHWSSIEFIMQRVSWMQSGMRVATYAQEIPRRLGAEAAADELAFDKKIMRRLAYFFENGARSWIPMLDGSGVEASEVPTEQERRWAAQLDVAHWIGTLIQDTERDRSVQVTHAIQAGDRRYANRVAQRLTSELEQLETLLTECQGLTS